MQLFNSSPCRLLSTACQAKLYHKRLPADTFEGFGRAFDKQCRGPPAAAVQSRKPVQRGAVVESVVGVVVEPRFQRAFL